MYSSVLQFQRRRGAAASFAASPNLFVESMQPGPAAPWERHYADLSAAAEPVAAAARAAGGARPGGAGGGAAAGREGRQWWRRRGADEAAVAWA
jgi:hypothetical protein